VSRITSEQALVRAMGTWGLAAGIVNVTIGGGIFRLPAAAAGTLGAAAPIAYVVCAAAMGLIVLCFAEAGSRVSLTGGLYAYVEVAFGPFVGFITGATLWAGITVATAAVSSFFADALVATVPALAAGSGRTIALIVILAALGALNVLGVRGASRFNALMTIAKLLPLALLIIVGFTGVRRANLEWSGAPATGDVARASIVLIFAFLGVETALAPSGEVRDTARTVPRAIFIAMLIVTIVYLAVQIVAQGLLGAALPGQKTPLAEAAAVVLGPAGRMTILIGTIVSMFGYVSGMTLAGPRMLYALGRDGFLPAAVAWIHPRFRTPYVAIVIQTTLVIALAASGSFEKLVLIANGSVLIVYAACCAAVLELRRRGIRQDAAPFRVPFAAVVPVLAIVLIVWLLSGLSADEWKSVLLMIALAVVVYVASLPARRAARAETSA
jgi:APA family basic amino acid/polyamine antiporter